MLATRAGRIDPAMVRVTKRPPIAFKPFAMLDPQTLKPISPDAEITLHNGRKMSARVYYEALNKLEQQLNAQGQTLRGPDKVIKVRELVIPSALLKVTEPNGGAARRPFSSEALEDVNTPDEPFREKVFAEALKESGRTQGDSNHVSPDPPGPGDTPDSFKAACFSQPWEWRIGDPTSFYARTHGEIAVKGGPAITVTKPGECAFNGYSVTGTIAAEGGVFGVTGEMLRATGTASSHQNGNTDLSFNVAVAGQTIYNVHKTKTPLQLWDKVSKGFEWSSSFPVDLGYGVTLDAKVGVTGDADLSYSALLIPTGAVLVSHGGVKSDVYAQASASAGIFGVDLADAGAEANMTLLNFNVKPFGQIGHGIDPASKKPFLHEAHYLAADITMLKGKVVVYAQVQVPGEDQPRRLEYSLFDYPGYHDKGTFLKNDTKQYFN